MVSKMLLAYCIGFKLSGKGTKYLIKNPQQMVFSLESN